MSVTIAVVQPRTNPQPDDAKNIEGAGWIERAAGEGAISLCNRILPQAAE